MVVVSTSVTSMEPMETRYAPTFPRYVIDLARNNNTAWFAAHKADYDEYVLRPARLFIMEMGDRLHTIAPGINADPRVNRSIFRIYRDTRFSRDKIPYKTHLGIWFWEGVAPRMECSGFYFHLEPGHLTLGSGMYRFPEGLLDKFREYATDRSRCIAPIPSRR